MPARCSSNSTPDSRMRSSSSSVRDVSSSSAATPRLYTACRLLRAKRQSHEIQAGSSDGRITSAPRGSSAERSPSVSTPGAASGVAMLGVTQPVLPADAPPPTAPASSTSTEPATSSSANAHAMPTTPPPTTTARISSMARRLPALEHGWLPVRADGLRALDPRAELRLRELAVLLLQLDAVGVPRLQMRDQDLARDLVLAPRGDREVDLQERVRIAVEHGRCAVLVQELDVLEPVDVVARRRGVEIDVLDERDVLLIRKPMAGQILRIASERLVRLMDGHPRITSDESGR